MFYGENREIHESLDKTFSGKGCNDVRGPVTTDSDTARQLSQQSEVTGELLGELGKINEIRSELLSVRRERRELQQQSRELMKTVQVRREREIIRSPNFIVIAHQGVGCTPNYYQHRGTPL